MADMFGGQGSGPANLCRDCKHRPAGQNPHTDQADTRPPCALSPTLDAFDARHEVCKGKLWEPRP